MERMSDDDFKDIKFSFEDMQVTGNPDLTGLELWDEANRARKSEKKLKELSEGLRRLVDLDTDCIGELEKEISELMGMGHA